MPIIVMSWKNSSQTGRRRKNNNKGEPRKNRKKHEEKKLEGTGRNR